MKIAVCFKVVTDYDKVTPKEIKKSDFSYTKKGFGFFDNGALELALRFKDANKGSYLLAITYGEYDEISFDRLYQLGFDKVVNIKGKEKVFDSKGVAYELANYLKNDYDLILTGEMVGPNDTGSLPYYLANYLILPILNRVTNFDNEKIYTEDGIYHLNGKLVLSISNSAFPYLRFPSYRDLERAKESSTEVLNGKKFKEPKITETKIEKKNIEYVDIDKVLKLLEVENV